MHRSRSVFYTTIGWPIWSILIGSAAVWGVAFYCNATTLCKIFTVLGLVEVFAVGLILQTEYTIESGGWLHITGPLIHKRVIAVADIRHIETIRDFSPAPAFSPNRLAIHHSTNEVMLVSPQRPADFIAQLKAFNQKIVIKM